MSTMQRTKSMYDIIHNAYDLCCYEKLIMLVFVFKSNVDETTGFLSCRLSFENIKLMTNIANDKTLRKHLKSLIDKGYVDRNRMHRDSEYIICNTKLVSVLY